jgi:hypothetical protein
MIYNSTLQLVVSADMIYYSTIQLLLSTGWYYNKSCQHSLLADGTIINHVSADVLSTSWKVL